MAYVQQETIRLYDAGSATKRSLRIEGAHSLGWSDADSLLLLAKEKGKDILCTIDRESLEITKRNVDEGAEAVFTALGNPHFLVFSKRVSRLSYGTEVALNVTAYETNTNDRKILYTFAKIYPKGDLDPRALLAWTHAGLHPLDNSLLVIEHLKPPVVARYSRVIMLDAASGEITEISGQRHDTTYTSASWSPDGNMIALTRRGGGLEVRSLSSKQVVLDQPVPGAYPSWSPNSDSIFIGGRLIFFDGKKTETLLSNAVWSIAAWSPDSTMLAASADGDLWLFRDLSRVSGRTDGARNRTLSKKVLLLQDLFRDKLISLQDYQERKARLLKRTESE